MADLFLDSVAVVTLVTVAVDTWMWIRTLFRIRRFERELNPRLEAIDVVAAKFGSMDVIPTGSQLGPLLKPPAFVPVVTRAKNGRPFVRNADGSTRFISEVEARALQSRRAGPAPSGGNGPDPIAEYGARLGLTPEQAHAKAAELGIEGGPENGGPADPLDGALEKFLKGDLHEDDLKQLALRLIAERQGGSEAQPTGSVTW
jgi:hypothetical protein